MKHVWCDKHQHSSHRHTPNTPLNINHLHSAHKSPNTHTHTPRTYTNHTAKPQPAFTHTHTHERTYIFDTQTQPQNPSIHTQHTHTQNHTDTHATHLQPPNSSIHTLTKLNTPLSYCTHQKARHSHTTQLIIELTDKNKKMVNLYANFVHMNCYTLDYMKVPMHKNEQKTREKS